MLITNQCGSLINGKIHSNGSLHPFTSPVTDKVWKDIHHATEQDITCALNAVKTQPLSTMTAYERASILTRIATLILEHKEELATIVTMEMGKPIKEALSEVDYAASFFHWFAGEAQRVYGTSIPSHCADKQLYVRYEPIGPAACITPWNFPLAMPARKFAAAFAAGCSMISKPSPETPLSQVLIGQLCIEAGIPETALHILIGDEEQIGNALLRAPHIRKLSFTGSCEVGKHLYRFSADTLKKITLELGGNAPFIVFDDANLERAITEAIQAKFRISGQTCVCANRFFIHKKVLPTFLEGFIQRIQNMTVGDPLRPDTDLTHSIHRQSQIKVREHIKEAIEQGAVPQLHAKEPFEPEVLTHVTPNMRIFTEETFGPVAPIITFEDEAQAIELANRTQYGLAAYVFTEGLQRAARVTSKLEFGMIGLNDGLPSCAEAPFGGIKDSGFGREGGASGIYEYLSEKLISQKL